MAVGARNEEASFGLDYCGKAYSIVSFNFALSFYQRLSSLIMTKGTSLQPHRN